MYSFANKTCIITGAANGLGKALATALYQQGSHLILLDTDTEGLEQLRSSLEKSTQKITVFTADVSDEAAIMAIATAVQNTHQQVDILINNAGISISQPFEQMSTADHERLFAVNYWGTVHCTRHFLPLLKNSADSRLVNIISSFALMGFPGKTAYASSKAAVMAFTASLRTELRDTSVAIQLAIPPPMATHIVSNGKHSSPEKQQAENHFLEKNGMPVNAAAGKILRGIKTGRYRIIAGHAMFWADFAARFFPSWINGFIGRKRIPFN